jgi:hypothetical protein
MEVSKRGELSGVRGSAVDGARIFVTYYYYPRVQVLVLKHYYYPYGNLQVSMRSIFLGRAFP